MSFQKPPYQISSKVLKLIQEISQRLGEARALNLNRPKTQLRKSNRIKSIHSSLAIEGNSLSLDQITSIIDERRVLGPESDIQEVKNAVDAYELLSVLNPRKLSDLLKVHKILMNNLINDAGKFRTGSVGIIKGNKVEHIAPSHKLVSSLVTNLLKYVGLKDELTLIKSCVFHYEIEFIHPFSDGNGRVGRIWQTLILMQEFPVFEFLPIEELIKNSQNEYYKALAKSDKLGNSTVFIEYMLSKINESLEELLKVTNVQDSFESRIDIARDNFARNEFSRLDYMILHKTISSSKASRDLKKATELKMLKKSGDKRTTKYRFN